MPQFRIWVFLNRVLCTRIHGYTVLLAPIKALPCLCFFPPMAEKSKPHALRVVGDSLVNDLKCFKNFPFYKDILVEKRSIVNLHSIVKQDHLQNMTVYFCLRQPCKLSVFI
jgi:hypothetical protein